MPPMFVHPPVCLYAPIHLYTPKGVHTPHGPHALSAPAWFWSIVCCGGVVFLLNVYWGIPNLFGGASPLLHPPTLLCWLPVHCYSQGYQFLCGAFPLLLKGLGDVSPITWGGLGGTSAICCSHVHSYTFFVVHYVSRLDHGSDYYSSSYCGIFWPVISVISVSGSFPNRVSRKPWCGATTTLDAEELWKCSWLRFCAAAAYSIFNASSGLCQLCYGFSTGRFLFQS